MLFENLLTSYKPAHNENEINQLFAMLSDLTEDLITEHLAAFEEDNDRFILLIRSVTRMMVM